MSVCRIRRQFQYLCSSNAISDGIVIALVMRVSSINIYSKITKTIFMVLVCCISVSAQANVCVEALNKVKGLIFFNGYMHTSQVRSKPLSPLSGRAINNIEATLKTSKILSKESVGEGFNNPVLLTLRAGMKAIWKPHTHKWYSNYRAEVLSYEIDRLIGFNLVPPTVERVIDGKLGSLQLFMESTGSSYGATETNYDKQTVLDYIINNRDRHSGNYIVSKSKDLISIDNGMSFTGKGAYPINFDNVRFKMFKLAQTNKGKEIVLQLKALLEDKVFLSEITEYLGYVDAKKVIKRIMVIIEISELERL